MANHGLRVQWEPSHGVGNELLDQQHRTLAAHCNALADGLADTSPEGQTRFRQLFAELMTRAREHFATEAAELAAKWGIKIYTIAIVGGETVTSIRTPFGVYKIPSLQAVDTSALQAIAEKTGGFYREAKDVASLREIYKEIDNMEKSEIESVRFIDYKELFHWFALAGLALILVETIFKTTLFRKIP